MTKAIIKTSKVTFTLTSSIVMHLAPLLTLVTCRIWFLHRLVVSSGHCQLHDPGRMPKRRWHWRARVTIKCESIPTNIWLDRYRWRTGARIPEAVSSLFATPHSPHLDGVHTVFGRTQDMAVVNAIARATRMKALSYPSDPADTLHICRPREWR